ncbi:MAG: hypothetical protein DMG39_20925 [Acidobacteria bacterium]|nr:MAG: hypothetical protein DMG39_20925 [Acidobacteriota bacterium]
MERSKRQYFSFCSQELRCSAQGRPSDLLSGCVRLVLLSIGFALLVAAAPSGEDPAAVLKRAFDAAKSALASGDLSNAERHYDEAIALGLRQLANLSVSESRFDEATRELDEALKFAPGDTEITTDAALAWFRAGNVKKARELVGSALAKDPRQARAQNVLGRIDLYRGDYESAIYELQASVALDDDFETSYFLGIAYLKAKRFADAQQWFQQLQAKMGTPRSARVDWPRLFHHAFSRARGCRVSQSDSTRPEISPRSRPAWLLHPGIPRRRSLSAGARRV